ncbi:unnamed protein product [Phytophthora lilii]|uniref:Unnamed protein product n=1 Tax=Phytophthora lilii TaxID=2077276 RepID=A0A9W6WLM1_9STRA|nr:unnamed protein product [Phytophthora lilii]
MAPRGFRPRRFLFLVAATALVALSISAASGEQHQKVSVDVSASEAETNGVTVPEFVATNEWQELLPGQGVPRREAKLVNPNEQATEESMRSVVVDPNAKETTVTVSTDITGDIVAEEDDDDTLTVTEEEISDVDANTGTDVSESIDAETEEAEPAEPNWNHEKIYDVLQALPEPPKVEGMDIHEAQEKLSPAEFRQQIVTLWKKRQAELKEALESLQDDAKYLGKLLEQFKDAEQRGDVEGQLSVLEVLEWEVQDLDKTHVFNFIGGFGIIAEYLNSNNLPVRAHAAWVVGSAAKNYKDGQEWAIDAGVMPKLIDSLTLEVPTVEEEAKDVLEVKKKAIYALSSIVRSNDRGQRLFSLHNGPELLAGLFNDAHPVKLQLKVIELVDAMRHQLPTCQDVHQASGVKTVVESLAKDFADDKELDGAEKQELALFFQDFLGRV